MIDDVSGTGSVKPFREQVEEARIARGLDQKELAELLGMSLRQYNAFVNGHTKNPQARNRRAMAEWLAEVREDDDPADTAAEPELDMCPECGAVQWPGDIRVFLDTLGAILLPMNEHDRLQWMHREVRRLMEDRP